MKKTLFIITVLLTITIFSRDGFAASYIEPRPKDDEAAIDRNSVSVSINRIVLIRKDTNYCAVKFTKCWTELDEERFKSYASDAVLGKDIAEHFRDISEKKYALYESYYQGDGTGELANRNVQVTQGKAFWLPPEGTVRLLTHQPGNPYVVCGPYKLEWRYKTFVSDIPYKKYPKDYGFELAPTPWTDIKEVNVKDPRIKWYRYDKKRDRVFIPIDKLWVK